MCYQRLSVYAHGEPYCLHGFNAVYLPEIGWYRVDARGNRSGIDAQFTPPKEQLAYKIKLPGEIEFKNILSEPLPLVIEACKASITWDGLLFNLLDISLELFEAMV
ncbi:hypothetical protein [Chlorogloeopsis sp. ULAP02]|uniref:hypothetical protein n=1 Tax=Chlorogloeopsis sp. ULAP02 TaxID=3107926 RepID=UPI00398B87CF